MCTARVRFPGGLWPCLAATNTSHLGGSCLGILEPCLQSEGCSPLLRLPPAAGLGRAPATALAWMWWFKGWHLEDAYEHLTGTLPFVIHCAVQALDALAFRLTCMHLNSVQALCLPPGCERAAEP